MSNIVHCANCGQQLQIPAEYAGRRVRCPSCKNDFVPGSPAGNPEARPTAPPARPDAYREQPPRADERPQPRRPGASRRWDDETDGDDWQSSRRPADEAPRSYRRWFFLAGVAIVVLASGVVFLQQRAERPRMRGKVPAFAQGFADKKADDQDFRDAFRDQKPLEDAELGRELDRFFDTLGQAYQAADAGSFEGLVDAERMCQELIDLGLLRGNLQLNRHEVTRGLGHGLPRAMVKQAPLVKWSKHEIKNIKRLPNNEVVVIVRHTSDDGFPLRMRWWVTRRHGNWRMYDMEDLDMGIRLSTAAGALLAATQQGLGLQDLARASKLGEAIQAVALQRNPDLAERKLKEMADVKLPPMIEAVRHMTYGLVHLNRQQPKEALASLEKAHALHPDMPVMDLLKGMTSNQLGRCDEALKLLHAYRDLLGEDAVVCRELGLALDRTERREEACVEFRKALDHDPKNVDNFLDLLHALLPGADRKDIGTRFAKLDNPRGVFDDCVDECRQMRDGVALEAIVAAMRTLDPRHRSLNFLAVLAKVWQGDTDQALALGKAALQREKNAGERDNFRREFLKAMTQAGKALAAYRELPDPTETFPILVAEARAGIFDDLEALVTEHAKKHPKDNLLNFCRGELHVREGQFALAEKAFAAGMVQPPEKKLLDQFGYSRITARYHTGGAMSAYEEFEPCANTLMTLANFAFHDQKYDLVESLLDRHARDHPGDRTIATYRIRVKIRQNKVDDAIATFKAALAKETQEQDREDRIRSFLFEMMDAGKGLEGYQAVPDARNVVRLLADDLLDRGRPRDLDKILEAHRRKFPADSWTDFLAIQVHVERGNWQMAVETLDAAWPNAPREIRDRLNWTYPMVLAKLGRANEAYDKKPDAVTFQQLANQLRMDEKADELEALIAHRRVKSGVDTDLVLWQARAKVAAKKPAEALALLRECFAKEPYTQAKQFAVSALLKELQDLGQGLEAYRAAPDRSHAFAALARELVFDKKPADLEKLVNEHAAKHPQEPQLPYYRGEVHLLSKRFEPAEKELTLALARKSMPDEWKVRQALNQARVGAGKTVSAYREMGSTQRVFQDLAYLCVHEKNAAQLEALVAARRQDNAPVSAIWDVEVRWAKKDYEGCLALLEKHRAELEGRPADRNIFAGYLVRCLVQRKRHEDAVREAKKVDERRGDVLLLVLAHAAHGDVEQTLATVQGADHRHFLIEDCYRDPDLGPILRSDPFAAFRKAFPETKSKRQRF